jgi:hypothetical protein
VATRRPLSHNPSQQRCRWSCGIEPGNFKPDTPACTPKSPGGVASGACSGVSINRTSPRRYCTTFLSVPITGSMS